MRYIVNITSNSDKFSDLSNETSTVWNVSAETHLRLWNAKYGSRMPRNRSTIFNVKVIHYPYNCEPLSKIGRLSLISIELNLFQELESVVHSVRRLNHDDWFVAVDLLIFYILMIPNKDALGSRPGDMALLMR